MDEHVVVVVELTEKSGKEGLFATVGQKGLYSP